jgi:dipeptidase
LNFYSNKRHLKQSAIYWKNEFVCDWVHTDSSTFIFQIHNFIRKIQICKDQSKYS